MSLLLAQWVALFGAAVASLGVALFLGRKHDETHTFAAIGMAASAILALRSGSVTVVSNGEASVHGAPELQFFGLILAVASLTTFIGALRADIDVREARENLGRSLR